ncbi:GNAT family N-acetyltransferase [Curtobacterium sp. MCBA15_008]|uniref:GNAT family N-acetyltransferase n=1 Tax=Curtobacterium sp. MCBA15_008 TaxID=1898736 RepID=UPI0011136331|nr:GNAT family N-acetyltransferase [Curtobacterium sp. MCBA15_008]
MTVVSVSNSVENFPDREEVRSLYQTAAEQPPLCEPPSSAELFATVYEASIKSERVIAGVARDNGRLVAFCYGHPWRWEEQQYPWADELRETLASEASELDDSYSLNLLARTPGEQYRGLGRRVLGEWLRAIDDTACWLQTSDVDSPALQLYVALGFTAIGHGPSAPNGAPGLVLLRPATRSASR